MTGDEQIWCGPYACSLSARSCAERHARSLEPGRVGRARSHMAHCRDCAAGHERWVALGRKRKEAAYSLPNIKRIREKSLAVYISRSEGGR